MVGWKCNEKVKNGPKKNWKSIWKLCFLSLIIRAMPIINCNQIRDCGRAINSSYDDDVLSSSTRRLTCCRLPSVCAGCTASGPTPCAQRSCAFAAGSWRIFCRQWFWCHRTFPPRLCRRQGGSPGALSRFPTRQTRSYCLFHRHNYS